ncbi:unnamed protein product [Cyprideis torosa]|uniref:Synaptosomal-associated protein n=1 Tax=Cyprideis torosa TaxID=163714 RepID=A0A7R8WAU5_9CRUS|nr:unnamed protein product [Cyprideis torosa]CAG0891472.1 unnamed protein product [Cyprideis torosa]
MPIPDGMAPRTDAQELQLKGSQLTDESLESTRRMVNLCEESLEVGFRTVETLDRGGEQLDAIEKGLDTINDEMKGAEEALRGMEKCCGLCALPCGKSKEFKEDESAWKEKDGAVVSSQPARVTDDRNGAGMPNSGYIARITKDAREDEMDDNMQMVHQMVGNLRNMAVDMGSEVDNQTRQLNRITGKAESDKERVRLAQERVTDQIKKS